ncbi:MAG: Na/Pi cotransporter family protein [Oscillospiraceae bacterium]|nr:Na/Pi cotransporter family protein [Oscillospiraceae bacterium]MDD7042267.1 Na/Pi cotransporter family protein [Oscillospiraceae bacterium]MDY2610290.1 Na/Pi cotransporter family protein [Oscillospiraceae bacterium]
MDIFSVFQMAGGLALFLYGMHVMGDGLEKQAGGKLKTILEKLTANPVKGFLLGAAVTAVIQSSSATTVMVVGFVNAGIMKLSQAIGIIMGANVGTTITSWILSLTGLQGDSFWIQLLKPTSFSPIIAFLGIILIMFSKKEGKKDLGSTLVGFAVLMFGMEQMSSAVEPLADVPEFTSILLLFSNPLLGVLCGAILTAVIQSSSASVGILQALSATGSVTYSSAIPIILGQNIGTCVTALISSIGANKNARRAAVVHLYFNLIGTGLFLAVFYLLNGFLHFSFYDQSIDRLGIAVVHTCFNLLSTLTLLPFTKLLEKLAYLTIRDTANDENFQILDERFLASPAVAIHQCQKMAVSMARLAQNSLYQAIGLIGAYDEKIAHSIEEGEDQIDMYEDKLGTYLVRLSSKNLTMEESREISKLLHVIGDFERIGDHAVNILKSAKEMQVKKYVFSGQAQQEISIISSAIEEIVDLATNAFVKNDLYLASKVEPLEQVVDSLKDELRNRHVQRLQNGECTISNGFIFSDLITNYERVADHCSNIGVCILRIAEDSFDTHEYLNHVKDGHDDTFENRYNRYKEKYQLA